MRECPNCGEVKKWHFHYGESDPGSRFNKLEPDQGECEECGFFYSEHIDYSTEEQVTQFREWKKNATTH